MVLVWHDATATQTIDEVRVVLAAEGQVDLRRPPEVERRRGIAEDGVHVGGHPPPVAFAREETEGERGPAQDVGVLRVRAERRPRAALDPIPGSAATRSQTPTSRATSIRFVRW